jgi:hypothetical protein
MRSILLATLVIAGFSLAATNASALPTLGGATLSTYQGNDTIVVANGCGPRRHWSWHWHRCVWN